MEKSNEIEVIKEVSYKKNMDYALSRALDALRSHGARGVPSQEEVERAKSGSKWYGRKKDGDRWYLVKHKPESYNAEF